VQWSMLIPHGWWRFLEVAADLAQALLTAPVQACPEADDVVPLSQDERSKSANDNDTGEKSSHGSQDGLDCLLHRTAPFPKAVGPISAAALTQPDSASSSYATPTTGSVPPVG
jgi:hypothetical protein